MQESSTSAPAHSAVVREVTSNAIWAAWVSIIGGGLYCLTIIGAIVGVPVLIGGLRLKESLESLNKYADTGSASDLQEAFEKQKTYWFIQKVLIIVGLVFAVIYLIAIATFLPAMMSQMSPAPSSFE